MGDPTEEQSPSHSIFLFCNLCEFLPPSPPHHAPNQHHPAPALPLAWPTPNPCTLCPSHPITTRHLTPLSPQKPPFPLHPTYTHPHPTPLTLHFLVVCRGVPHEQRRSLAVEGVRGVGVEQQLGEEGLKHVHQVCTQHGTTRYGTAWSKDRRGAVGCTGPGTRQLQRSCTAPTPEPSPVSPSQ